VVAPTCTQSKSSTGFYGIMLAIQLCAEVNVYLFSGTSDHYYNKVSLRTQSRGTHESADATRKRKPNSREWRLPGVARRAAHSADQDARSNVGFRGQVCYPLPLPQPSALHLRAVAPALIQRTR